MPTDTTRWRRIRELIEAALELEGKERDRFVASSCGSDAALRAEVQALLAQDPSQGFLERPAIPEPRSAPVEGRRIGAFALVREIGSGGMGKVYLAEREGAGFRQRVAIKVLKRGMDTEDILRRFHLERQLLAGLEHPNIARFHDGGATEDGLPYFALEFVDGVAIDRWCDSRRATVRERIELFLLVCSAVHHAHQNLVVHRDLKPSNILVTEAGVPKLLDFGIAKVLLPEGTERTIERTSTEQRLLTPAYASPEQLRGEPITTASDVFSLGVVLYELLVGAKPFPAEVRGTAPVRALAAEKPSTALRGPAADGVSAARRLETSALRRRLAGDLDTIVLTALQPEPGRRYPTVAHLAADLRRHLDGLPVLARPDTWRYRTSKFVARNKLVVAASVGLFLTLAVGFTTSLVLYLEAARAKGALQAKSDLAEKRLQEAELARGAEKVQRQLAEQRFDEVRRLATTFIFEVHRAIEPLHGSLPARELIVKTATEYLERLAREKKDDDDLQLQLADSWLRIGEIQCSRAAPSFGNTEAALKSYRQALTIAEDLSGADPASLSRAMLLVQSQVRVVEMLMILKRLPEARSLCESALATEERILATHPESLDFQRERVRDHTRLAEILRALGDHAGALAHLRTACDLSRDLARDWVGSDEIQLSLAGARSRLAEILDESLESEEALAEELRATAIFRRIVPRNPDRRDWQREAAVCRNMTARIYGHLGCLEEAIDESFESLQAFLLLSRGDVLNYAAAADAAVALAEHAGLLLDGGRRDEAEIYCRWSIDRLDDLVRRDPWNLEVRRNLAMADGFLASILLQSGDDDGAKSAFLDGRNSLEEISGDQPSDRAIRIDLYQGDGTFGAACLSAAGAPGVGGPRRLSRCKEAETWLGSAIAGLRDLDAAGASTPASRWHQARFEASLARCRDFRNP